MSKARLVEFLLIGYRNPDTDTPVSKGEAYFYKNGTSTLGTIWQDRDKNNEASNPVELDDQGRAEVFGDDIYQVDIHEPRISSTQKGALIESIPGLDIFVNTIGKEIGELAAYEDDGSGNPKLDNQNAAVLIDQNTTTKYDVIVEDGVLKLVEV